MPGSGKTTVCNYLVDRLEQLGKKSIPFQEYNYQKIKTWHDSVRIFFKGIHRMSFRHKLVFLSFFCVLPVKAPNKCYRMYLLILNYILFAECTKEYPDAFVVADQCFIQEIVSCFYDQHIFNKKAIKSLVSMIHNNYYVINSNVSVDIASQRIINRKNGESRIDTLEKEEVIRTLLVQKENFKDVWELIEIEKIPFINIDTMLMPSQNVEMILEDLQKRKCNFD